MSKKTVNKTDAIQASDRASDYVNKFTIAVNKCAENVLEMCKVVHDAKAELRPGEFEFFCQKICLKPDSSAISKMKTIGESYERFIGYKDELPSAWTTLYLISRMNPEDFQRAHYEKVINPMTTAKQLKSYAPYLFKEREEGNAEAIETITGNTLFSIKTLNSVATDKFDEFKEKLLTLCTEYQFELAQ